MKLKNNKKGFTLIELVIVIAVIAILAAVLIPTFGSVINNARKSAAEQEASNLRTAIIVEYQGSFDEYCTDYAGEKEVTSESYILIDTAEDADEKGATFGDYITVEGEITIEVGKISYTTESGYDVVITATDITVTK